MAYITLDDSLHGMRKLLAFKPVIAESLIKLMEGVMRSDDGLSLGERELIASYVSYLNDCNHCKTIHGEVAICLLENEADIIDSIRTNYHHIEFTNRINAILNIAKCVQLGGKHVANSQIDFAKKAGLTEMEIHDTVLISSMFCMFNRYIDGLGVESTDTDESFKLRAKYIADNGYS